MRRAVSTCLWCSLGALSLVARVAAGDAALSNELHPSWSPDGTRIVFESNRRGNNDLYVFDLASGDSRRITDAAAEDGSPVWSPDGRWIAFHSNREGNYDLYVIRPDGSELRRLTRGANDEMDASWHPSSQELVYSARIDETTWHLFVVDTRSLETRPLVESPGSSLTPTWISPTRVAFSHSPPGGNHDSDIVLKIVSSTGVDLGELLAAGNRGNSNIQYSAAAGRIVFNSIRDGNWEIYSAKVGGASEVRLTTNAAEETTGIDGQPDWSPAGDRIAITSGRAGSFDIVILRSDGFEERNLTSTWTRDDG